VIEYRLTAVACWSLARYMSDLDTVTVFRANKSCQLCIYDIDYKAAAVTDTGQFFTVDDTVDFKSTTFILFVFI